VHRDNKAIVLLPTGPPKRKRAMQSGQLSAAVAAIREIGVLSGQRIERKEVGAPGAFDDLTDDRLERALRERFNALGLAGSDTRQSARITVYVQQRACVSIKKHLTEKKHLTDADTYPSTAIVPKTTRPMPVIL
jgi:hypothetical protein